MYNIESKPAAKAVWFTPSEARSYYGKYARDGITIHWWGDNTGANNHDNIVNYFLRRTDGSVNYVLSDNKITMMVDPDNVAWTSQSGNATTISIEHQPTLSAEGYKKSGWLVWQLEQRYGKTLKLYPHNYWWSTQCPGTLSLDRIRQEADKWKRGEYNTPAPTPPTAAANLEWIKFASPVVYKTNKQPTSLWDFNKTAWNQFTQPVKTFGLAETFVAYGRVINHTLNATYLVTEYSFTKKIANGVNEADLSLPVQPVPPPTPIPAPEPEKPEWVKNIRDIDNTIMWVKQDCELIDITTGKPTGTKRFAKDEEFVASALTSVGKTEYRLTDYSYKKGVYSGVPTDNLTLTAPGVPNIPPVPQVPATIDKNVVIAFLETIVRAITNFIDSLRKQ